MGGIWNLRQRAGTGILPDSDERKIYYGDGPWERDTDAHSHETFWRPRRAGRSGGFPGLRCGQLRHRDDPASGWRGSGKRCKSVNSTGIRILLYLLFVSIKKWVLGAHFWAPDILLECHFLGRKRPWHRLPLPGMRNKITAHQIARLRASCDVSRILTYTKAQ